MPDFTTCRKCGRSFKQAGGGVQSWCMECRKAPAPALSAATVAKVSEQARKDFDGASSHLLRERARALPDALRDGGKQQVVSALVDLAAAAMALADRPERLR